ncbi:protein DCL, chloroplastic [Coffea arabica]|nr:protein DCL, chloroplastic-like [Coffea arabica]XP_027095204.1 protein DCL, chloroplastic-like [Coffea arabica]XP_027095205.1 protein DCL, chloroplastic-like [Coffea arabica]
MIMASISSSKFMNSSPFHNSNSISSNLLLSPPSLSFQLYPYNRSQLRRYAAVRTTSSEGRGSDSFGAELLRKPVVSPAVVSEGEDSVVEEDDKYRSGGEEVEAWVDWEDQILQDTVPLVNFVRMILHSGKYESGDRLSPEHERTILERVLPYHPQCEKKIGSGVDYITIGYHPDFDRSRCLFIVRKDGELVDFSYWKCIKGLIRKNYPLYADTFIIRHFKKPRRSD